MRGSPATRGQAIVYSATMSITGIAGYASYQKERWVIGFADSVSRDGRITAWRAGLHSDAAGKVGSRYAGRPKLSYLIDPAKCSPGLIRAALVERGSDEFATLEELRSFVKSLMSPEPAGCRRED